MHTIRILGLLPVVIAVATGAAHAASELNFGGRQAPAGDLWPLFRPIEPPPAMTREAAVDRPSAPPADVAGRWVGTWTGMSSEFRRTGQVVAEFAQSGHRGAGWLMLQDANAAEGVPSQVRLAGTVGVGVRVAVEGAEVTVTPDRGSFALELVAEGDRLVGRFDHGAVRLILTRESRRTVKLDPATREDH
jgi:hypothetical protein